MIVAHKPAAWSEWYLFARETLDFEHDESVEYANLRLVEEQNRLVLRGARPVPTAARKMRIWPLRRPRR